MIYVSTCCLKGENSKFTKNIFKVLEVYKKLGIKNIELGSVHSPFKDKGFFKKYKKENNANFTIHGFFPPAKKPIMINIASSDERIFKISITAIKNAIKMCNELEIDFYSFHPGFMADLDSDMNFLNNMVPYEKAMENLKRNIEIVCDFADEHGIKIALENQWPVNKAIMFCKTEEFERLFNKVKIKNLGLLIDIGHLKFSEKFFGQKPADFIKKFQNKALEIHTHGFDGKKDHQKITDKNILKDFDKEILKKIVVALESNGLTEKEILESKGILEKAC